MLCHYLVRYLTGHLFIPFRITTLGGHSSVIDNYGQEGSLVNNLTEVVGPFVPGSENSMDMFHSIKATKRQKFGEELLNPFWFWLVHKYRILSFHVEERGMDDVPRGPQLFGMNFVNWALA